MFSFSYVSCVLFALSPLGSVALTVDDCEPGDDKCASVEEASLLQRTSSHTQTLGVTDLESYMSRPMKPIVYHPTYTVGYPAPGAAQTHELAIMPSSLPGLEVLLVSQISSSRLVQMSCDGNGICNDAVSNTVGNMYDGLHGLEPSDRIFGSWGNLVVITLQFSSKIAMLNVSGYPSLHDRYVAPKIEWTYDLLSPENEGVDGPHRTVVLDNDVWSSCKESQDIVRLQDVYGMSDGKWVVNPAQKVKLVVYPVQVSPSLPRAGPIFIQAVEHADGKKYMYGSLDAQGYLARVSVGADVSDPKAATKFINVNAEGTCPIPVGMIKGPDAGSVWFTCGAAGTPTRGTSTFASLYDNEDMTGNLTIMETGGAGTQAGSAAYLHLAWGFGTKDGFPQLALMSSSIFGGDTEDGVTTVTLSKDLKQIKKNAFFATSRRDAKNHRVIVREKVMYVDGTSDGVVTAHYQEAQNSYELTYNPSSDYSGHGSLGLYGQGIQSTEVIYDEELTKRILR